MENGAAVPKVKWNVQVWGEGFIGWGVPNMPQISSLAFEECFFILFWNLCHVHVGNVKEMDLYSARRALPVGEAAEARCAPLCTR